MLARGCAPGKCYASMHDNDDGNNEQTADLLNTAGVVDIRVGSFPSSSGRPATPGPEPKAVDVEVSCKVSAATYPAPVPSLLCAPRLLLSLFFSSYFFASFFLWRHLHLSLFFSFFLKRVSSSSAVTWGGVEFKFSRKEKFRFCSCAIVSLPGRCFRRASIGGRSFASAIGFCCCWGSFLFFFCNRHVCACILRVYIQYGTPA